MVQSGWAPEVPQGGAPLWQRLVDVLQGDVQGGDLAQGTRLPPHRDLAHRLGVGVGTVSRAYLEAERRGLVTSHVGRGTFVAGAAPAPVLERRPARGPIDMSRNLPPIAPALARLGPALEALRRREDVDLLVDYSPAAGSAVVREAGARWLREQGQVARATARRLIQTNGGQHGLMIACSSFAGAGGTILCNAATYPGYRTIAEHGGWRLRGIAADARGMDPELLDRAAAETGARLLLLIPTLHNPTATTLDRARREEIAAVARARGLTIVEDDVYRVFARAGDPPPFAELAPERTIHVTSLSKALAPGLRLGLLLAPDDDAAYDRLLLAAQATGYCPPAAGGLIFAQWQEDGSAARILAEVRAETARRNRLAREILGEAMAEPDSDCSPHVWLPMSAERANRVAAHALEGNVEVTPPSAPFVDPATVSGLRLCLGTARDMAELEYALRTVKAALDDQARPAPRGIV